MDNYSSDPMTVLDKKPEYCKVITVNPVGNTNMCTKCHPVVKGKKTQICEPHGGDKEKKQGITNNSIVHTVGTRNGSKKIQCNAFNIYISVWM